MTTQPRFGLSSALSLVSLSTFVLAGCAKGPLCADLGNCGGDPTGVWVSNSDVPACIDGPYFTPTTVSAPGAPLDNTLFGRPAQVANTPLPQSTLSAWCEGLILQKDLTNLVKERTFVFQDPIISGLSISFHPDLTYEAGFVRSGRFSQYYSQTCITQYGQNPNDCPNVQATLRQEGASSGFSNATCAASGSGCDCANDAGAHLSGQALVCQMVGIVLNSKAVDETFKNIACAPNASRGGCDCGFDVAFPSGEVGVYERDGSTITTHPQNNSINVPSKMTYCVSGPNNLEVSGYENSYLFDKAPVRNFKLTRYVPPANP